MSKKSKKRKEKRQAKKQNVKLRVPGGGTAYGYSFAAGACYSENYQANKCQENEDAAYETKMREKMEALYAPGEFWVSALDTPEQIVKRFNALPLHMKQDVYDNSLLPWSRDGEPSQRVVQVALYMIENKFDVGPSVSVPPAPKSDRRRDHARKHPLLDDLGAVDDE